VLSPEECAALDAELEAGKLVTVDVLYEDGTWQSEHDAAARERPASRAGRMVDSPRRSRRSVLVAETQMGPRSRRGGR
jgi:hypothetical protein